MATPKSVVISMLVLRMSTLAASIAAIALLATMKIDFFDLKTSFKDFGTYRFEFSAAVISAAYTLVQLPFTAYHAIKEKRMIRKGHLADFDFYGDMVISLLLAAGVAAGLAVSIENKEFYKLYFNSIEQQQQRDPLIEIAITVFEELKTLYNKFFNTAIIASCVLLVALICMAVVSVLSSLNRNKKR